MGRVGLSDAADSLAKHKVVGSTPITRSLDLVDLAAGAAAENRVGCMGACSHFAASTASCIFRRAASCAASWVMR